MRAEQVNHTCITLVAHALVFIHTDLEPLNPAAHILSRLPQPWCTEGLLQEGRDCGAQGPEKEVRGRWEGAGEVGRRMRQRMGADL